MSISRGLTGSTAADASFLVDHLNLQLDGGPYWEQWSIDHPNETKVFWPIIQRLAGRELYVLLPELFELAQQDRQNTNRSGSELQTAIDDHLRREYLDLIGDLNEAGRADLARQLRGEALDDFPNDERLRSIPVGSPRGLGGRGGQDQGGEDQGGEDQGGQDQGVQHPGVQHPGVRGGTNS